LFVTVIRGYRRVGPDRADIAFRELERQRRGVRTTRLRRPQASALVRSAARVHRIPSRVRDDRDTPLQWDETATDIKLIWVRREAIFRKFRNKFPSSSQQLTPVDKTISGRLLRLAWHRPPVPAHRHLRIAKK
jgi:hypothetical protein